jgi:geranylgeranylglycerol-phosphate geranylgeranyltransferase
MLNPWIKFIRPLNGLMGIFGTFISGLIALGFNLVHHLVVISIAAFCVFMVTSGGNILNDVVDVESDRKNHPRRPLVTGKISASSARIAFYAFFLIPVVVAAFYLNLYAALIVFLAEVLLISYELKTKNLGLSGNITISVLVGFIFVFGGISLDSAGRMLFLFLLAFLANLSREIIKDIQDMGGDVGRRTLPMAIGQRNSAVSVMGIIIALVIISFIPYFIGLFSLYYLIVVAVTDIVFILSSYATFRNPERGQQISKIGMILGLISFAVGGLT